MSFLTRTWQRRLERASSRWWSWLVVALVVLGAVGGIGQVWRWVDRPDPPDLVTPGRVVANQNALVGSFAVEYVTTWLTLTAGHESTLRAFVSPQVRLQLPTTLGTVITAPTPTSIVFDPSTSSAETSMFSVIVSVFERPYASATPARAFYQVSVSVDDGAAMLATAMPSKVQPPPKGHAYQVDYKSQQNSGSKAWALASGFLTAYLTGTSGIERYTTANSPLSPVGGYEQVQVQSVEASEDVPDNPTDGQTVHLLVTVVATTSDYNPMTMQYPLTIVGGAGAWSVQEIDPTVRVDYSSSGQ
ncbi:conjugal transfer protein [Tsukamurella sp. 8F]|uniref:conjugal transfer protein n=1 Tax=unclassified Tsukamurella TaxID=2633480 RepID=UPI0023B9B48B|nr:MULTISPECIES: conjugal transfer protein [unclassified Tsukamurella]MDF0531126.1 conjugal transfer protein [Tsukamurella sp. 8J]MDF0588372.1 conjugal transfer protein [Tsukamurella sp. 8F]